MLLQTVSPGISIVAAPKKRRTIACTGAGGWIGFKWTVITAGPVMRVVRTQKIMSIEKFAHMWDGSEDGWTLHYFDRKAWRIAVRFPEGRPSIQDVSKLRLFDDDLRNVPASSLWAQLRGVASFSLASEFSNIDIHAKMRLGSELGLQCECECIDLSGYLAVHENGSAMIIEDDDEAKQVTRRMLDAGVPIVETHVD